MLGEGVGGAYINASAIRNGVHNRGGEFGHMVIHPGGKQCLCGKKGCFEAYVSEKVLSSELDMTLDNFFELAAQGNKNNSNVLDEYMDNLALMIIPFLKHMLQNSPSYHTGTAFLQGE